MLRFRSILRLMRFTHASPPALPAQSDTDDKNVRAQGYKHVDANIFQASTSEVYEDLKIHPQTEDYWGKVNPIGIRSCYNEGTR